LISAAAEKEGLNSFVALPLWAKDVLHGGLVLANRSPRRFGADELELLQAIASQIAIGMENAKLFENARR
jgi:GAF domain-containing protein